MEYAWDERSAKAACPQAMQTKVIVHKAIVLIIGWLMASIKTALMVIVQPWESDHSDQNPLN
jgi:hypothetical protein